MARPPAPGELELVRGFVNTLDVESGTDEIDTQARLRAWLAERGLVDRQVAPAPEDVVRVTAFRESLRSLLLANGGEPVDPDAVAALNRLSSSLPAVIEFDASGHVGIGSPAPGVDGALVRLLSILFRSMAEGTWHRLKACRSDACQWAFYDHSKNHSGLWCDMAVCGNRMKVRRYQQRRRPGESK